MMNVEKHMEERGIFLPLCPEPAANYIPAVLSGNVVHVAGQTPKVEKKLVCKGKLGREVSTEEGYQAARLCAVRALSALKGAVGDLDCVEQIVRLRGYVNAADDFTEHALVVNGASDLLAEVFGDRGRHSRVAVGASSLPGGAAVEIELDAIIKMD